MNFNSSAAAAYANTANMVTPIRSVIMLYDGVLRLVRGARKAIEEGRIEDRFTFTQKASKIILGLQASLDWQNGGDVTPTLDGFYNTIFMRLQQINYRNSIELCDDVLRALENVKASWVTVEEQLAGGKPAPPPTAPTGTPYGQKPQAAAREPQPEAPSLPTGGLGITI